MVIKKILSNLFIKKRENNILKASFLIDNIENELAFCSWILSSDKKEIINDRKIYCLSIRIFDITNENKLFDKSCIMKEFEFNKKIEKFPIPLPIKTGQYKIELGYKTKDNQWNLLISESLNLGNRKMLNIYPNDSWFFNNSSNPIDEISMHQKMFRFSSHKEGNSSNIIKKVNY
tara:strand:+ start:381 stop:905 length:525 start_codon:yes stop_codon:yes gene_type:complete